MSVPGFELQGWNLEPETWNLLVMTGSRRRGRELALQALYQFEITHDHSVRARQDFWQGFAVAPQTRRFADELLDGVLERREEIDRIIGEHSDRWRLDRLSKVDLNVIRLAVHEMSRTPPLPVEIAINEAVEIARRFGTGESSRFVNGLLDQIAGRLGLKRASPPPAAGRKHEDTTTRRHEEKDL